MLLNYDFLELVDEPQRNTSLTASIDKALADRKLARQNKPRVKIKSGLSFGTISAFRPFKDAFIKDFTEKEREKLVEAYKSGYKASQLDKVAKNWNNDPNPIDASYIADAFLREYRTIALKLSTALGKSFVGKFLNPKSETTMKDLMSSKEFVERYRYTQKDNMERTQQLKRLLDSKRDFIGYIQVIGYWKESVKDDLIPDKETSFFVFVNEPSSTFDLKNHLLIWGKQFKQAAICYGGQMLANKNKTYRIDLISSSPNSFGKVWAKFTGIKFSVPSDLPQALTRINDSVYTFLSRYKGGICLNKLALNKLALNKLALNKIVKTELKATCMPFDYSKLGIESVGEDIRSNIKALQKITRGYGHPKEFFLDAMIERQENAIKRIEARKCAVSEDYRQGMKRNILVSKIANALRQGKKVSRTLIAKVLANTIDTDAGYCFISDLATQLGNISPRLSKSIVTAIEQAEGVRLTYALIDKITYNSLHNILSFIFDIDNPLSDQVFERLVIEVPREALKNVKLPQIKNVLTAQIFEGAYQFRGNDYKFKS
ncbi:hypothetical protein [Helicobacter pylori]|uniref:hypothetical protein n=1 Tax=Helicobacter pylori TaxID=210 RepID=UPI000FDE37F6|nr:hypothetical protein [Helicobacter pylori]RVZ87058.1 hypothetical protein EC601_01670 [Helicobacter pylori]